MSNEHNGNDTHQSPLRDQMILHSSGDEQVCISRASKGTLKPESHQRVGVYRFWGAYHTATFTNGWEGPNFRASMLYPRLCQSMMILLLLTRPTSQTRPRVGMLGGFLECVSGLSCTHPEVLPGP